MKKGANGVYNRFFKRALDILCALLAMVLFCWLYVVIAILVRVKLGSPVIFRQDRPGRINKKTGIETIFSLYKFRSMNNAKDENGELQFIGRFNIGAISLNLPMIYMKAKTENRDFYEVLE